MHIGVDNLNVVNHVSSLIANRWSGRPFPLVNDGDLLCLAQRMVRSRGRGNTLVSKVKGHADEGLVAMGPVREVDRIGNNETDAAADMGRWRVHDSITDARRLFNAVKELQHFFIAIARTVVNLDDSGGTSLHPTVWSSAANAKRRRVHRAVRDLAWLPGPESLWTSVWRSFPGLRSLMMMSVPGSVSCLELLILCERWAGERLVLEKVLPYGRRAGRPAVPFGQGIDTWHSCRFIGSIFRFLDRLPGGFRRFIPCKIWADHCRLRHIVSEKCGHGLASRPLETADPGFLDALLQVFGYSNGSGALLLAAELPVRYCTDRFALRKPCWGLPQCGHVRSLLTPAGEGVGLVEVAPVVSNGGGVLDKRSWRGLEENAAHQENEQLSAVAFW